MVRAFPQRPPPWLLTTPVGGGLRSTPDCRPRRALLHLSYSCAPLCGPAMLVTHDPERASHWATLTDAGSRSGQNCSDFLLRLREPGSEWPYEPSQHGTAYSSPKR